MLNAKISSMRCIESEKQGPGVAGRKPLLPIPDPRPPAPFLMQPEISKRCSSCGASIRQQDLFCRECGQSLSKTAGVSAHEVAVEASTAAAEKPIAEDLPVAAASTAASSRQSADSGEEKQPAPKPVEATEPAGRPTVSSAGPGKVEKPRGKFQRASSVARGALEENVKRVDKRVDQIRHASTAVLEEASYDPSLRFVLVALAVFLVFVILLVLSKVMG